MHALFVFSILVRLLALAWSIVWVRRLRDWRMGLMAAMLGVAVVRHVFNFLAQSGTLAMPKYAIEGSGLLVSLMLLSAVVILARIMTDQARLLAEARDAEQRYRSIFDNSVEGIFQTTPAGRFISANSAMAHMLGYESPRRTTGWCPEHSTPSAC